MVEVRLIGRGMPARICRPQNALLTMASLYSEGRPPGESIMAGATHNRTKFLVEIIKPSHYDDDGYVIQWIRGFIPSNSLACLYGLALDAQRRRVLGADVHVALSVY